MTGDSDLVDSIGFDHVNLKTRDMTRAINFYVNVLGMRLVRAERDDREEIRFASLRFGNALIDLQPNDGDWSAQQGGLNHIALLIEPTDLNALAEKFREMGVRVTEGPVRRQGAFGYGQALYIQDPDGHGVELKHYDWPMIAP